MVASTSIDSGIVELISQILEQPLTNKQVTPRVVFITALATALVGVVFADGAVSEQEKQRLQKTLKQFMPEGSSIGQLIRQLVQGIQKQKLYSQGASISKLTETLSDSEKLLILCFSYEIAKADGEIAAQEQQYIQNFSKILGLEPTHIEVIQTLWNEAESASDLDVLEELHGLLDPHQFQGIDPVFAKAANYICNKFPKPAKIQSNQASSISIAYTGLEQFQQARKQLDELCLELYKWVEECSNHFALPKNLKQELAKLSKSLQSQKFRLAVVGEFSQGKSTLLNALLGEEVQPVRVIPCSGTVTVLRYGSSRRVICKYKDEREEEIPFELYGEKASIPEDAVLSDIGSELAKSEIKEIILEHPDLTLCRHGVEIVDSPGLNEHPERTAITQQLLQETDAAIFLANASRPLTQGERELLVDLKQRLNHNQADQPAENLFVLVNFMDLLRREKDREQVRQLFTTFLRGNTPIVSQDSRLHFISAQAALDALLDNNSDEYLESLQQFTSSLEHFLTRERGSIELSKVVGIIQNSLQEGQLSLAQIEHVLNGQVDLSGTKREQIVNQIGEASGRAFKLKQREDELVDELKVQLAASWKEWATGIEDRIAKSSERWTTNAESNKQVLKDFSNRFTQEVNEDIGKWISKIALPKYIQPKLESFSAQLQSDLIAIQKNLDDIDSQTGSNVSQQFSRSLSNLGVSLTIDAFSGGVLGFLTSLSKSFGLSGLVFCLIPGLWVALAAGSAVGLVTLLLSDKIGKLKKQVLNKGLEKLSTSKDQIFEQVFSQIQEEVKKFMETGSEAIESSISILDALLGQYEGLHQEALSKQETEKSFIQLQQAKLLEIEEKLCSIENSFIS